MIYMLFLSVYNVPGEDISFYISNTLLFLAVLLYGIAAHSCAQGYMARLLGDDSEELRSRLTINPFMHFDWKGIIWTVIIGFGGTKPMPINFDNIKHRKLGLFLINLSGLLTNFILAVLNTFLYVLMNKLILATENTILIYIASTLYFIFLYAAIANFYQFILNGFPLYPYAGMRLFLAFFPEKIYLWVVKNQKIILFSGLAIIFVLGRFGISPIDFLFDWLDNGFSDLFVKMLSVSTPFV